MTSLRTKTFEKMVEFLNSVLQVFNSLSPETTVSHKAVISTECSRLQRFHDAIVALKRSDSNTLSTQPRVPEHSGKCLLGSVSNWKLVKILPTLARKSRECIYYIHIVSALLDFLCCLTHFCCRSCKQPKVGGGGSWRDMILGRIFTEQNTHST